QLQSIACCRELGSWLQRDGLNMVPNIRWACENTYDYAFDGIESGGTVAVGTIGCMREKEPRLIFETGFMQMIERIAPKRVVVCGSVRSSVFSDAESEGIEIIHFPSATSRVHAKEVE
ncbi:MAG: DUF4417 domain-containing protein, partial [Coriobacteriales bacterium]|nr:DUF4417 domain-containing protein [Coriobacteriales bacterium]